MEKGERTGRGEGRDKGEAGGREGRDGEGLRRDCSMGSRGIDDHAHNMLCPLQRQTGELWAIHSSHACCSLMSIENKY